MKKKIIGVLGGMGPKSTAPFINLVIEECQKQYGAKEDLDFPHMLIYSLPTPFYVDKPINSDAMIKTVCQGLKKLEKTGVDFIAIPCNTVHAYFSDFKKCIKVPILNIVDETLRKIPKNIKNIGLFATQPTIDSAIYQKELLNSGFKLIYDLEIQKQVNCLIKEVKTSGKSKKAEKSFNNLIKYLLAYDVGAVIIACTDLSVFCDKNKNLIFIDSSKSLAEAVIEKYLA